MNGKSFPRIIIAGTSSGVGKTTVSLAVMAALSRRGLKVQGFKVGPDFIDPGYYATVTGRPGRNLDSWMAGAENAVGCFLSAADDADVSVIEGVMGLYDGRAGMSEGSTGDIAKLVDGPVLLTLDCSKMGASAGAMALGYVKYDRDVNIRGFILNKIGSARHEEMVKTAVEAATGLPVVGCIRRTAQVALSERHLGLVTQVETEPTGSYVESLVELASAHIDLDALLDIARSTKAPPFAVAEVEGYTAGGRTATGNSGAEPGRFGAKAEYCGAAGRKTGENGAKAVRIGVAYDKAFCFYYHDNFDILRRFGAELVFFSPLRDDHLPENLDGLYIGGGYPEVHAGALSGNRAMASEVKGAVESGLPVYAECGGLIYLSRAIEDFDGISHEMSGALPVEYKMQNRATLGYREATALGDSVIARKGERLRGHEFHYSAITKAGAGLQIAYKLDNGREEGFIYKNTLATYVHLHFAGKPELAGRFVAFCRQRRDPDASRPARLAQDR